MIKHIGKIENKHFVPENKEWLKDQLSKYEGKQVRLEITGLSKKVERTLKQNNYYWGVVVKYISDEIGDSKDDIHSVLRTMFLSVEKLINDVSFMFIKSTTDLDTKEFNDYVTECRNWASSFLNLYLPEPNEYDLY